MGTPQLYGSPTCRKRLNFQGLGLGSTTRGLWDLWVGGFGLVWPWSHPPRFMVFYLGFVLLHFVHNELLYNLILQIIPTTMYLALFFLFFGHILKFFFLINVAYDHLKDNIGKIQYNNIFLCP